MKISYLADYPEFIEIMAPWIYEHWRACLIDETLDARIEKLRSHLNKDTLPIAFVAHAGTEVFGTAALRVHDLPGRDDLTPWLGGVFVAEPFRNRGIGTKLCAAVEEKAKFLFGQHPLYLFTLDKQSWYQNQGWSFYDSCAWCGSEGDIMVKQIV